MGGIVDGITGTEVAVPPPVKVKAEKVSKKAKKKVETKAEMEERFSGYGISFLKACEIAADFMEEFGSLVQTFFGAVGTDRYCDFDEAAQMLRAMVDENDHLVEKGCGCPSCKTELVCPILAVAAEGTDYDETVEEGT